MKGAAEVGGTAAEDRLPPIKPRSTPPTTTRPFRPPLVKRNNNNNKDDVHVRPSQAPTTSSTWPPPGEVGMHDARFYEEVAHELSLDAPVLHSVIHTHKWLNEKPRTTANTTAGSSSTNNNNNNTQPNDDVVKKDDDEVVEEGVSPIDALRAQIDAIGDDVHRWKVGRLADAAQDSSAKDAEASMQNAMDARLFHKRSEEQDRAMRRIREIVNRVGDQLDVARSKITKFGADVCCNEEEKRQRVEENVDANLRLALDRHDRERDERVAHRLTEVRSFTQSWLVERDLQRKYEERQSCLRQHWLDGYDIHQEEERERRRLRAAYLTEKCTVGLMTDETGFREGLVMDEAARRCAIVGKREDVLEAILQRHAAASNKAEDDAVDEDDDDEGEDENDDDDDDVLEVEAPTQVAPQSQPPTTTTSMASPPSDMRLDEDCPKTIVTHLRPVEELSMTNTISGGVSSPPPPAGNDDDDNAGARDEAHEENDDGNDDDDDHHHHEEEEEVALPPQPSEEEPHNAEMVPVASTNPLDSPAVVQSSKENSLTEDGAMLSDHASTEPYDELHSSRRMARLEEDESVDVEE